MVSARVEDIRVEFFLQIMQEFIEKLSCRFFFSIFFSVIFRITSSTITPEILLGIALTRITPNIY